MEQQEGVKRILEDGQRVLQQLAFAKGSRVSTRHSREEVLGRHAALTVADSLQREASADGQIISYIWHRAPCSSASLSTLKKVRIGELTWCEPAQGRVLVVRTISTARATKQGALHSVVEDEGGDVHNLFVHNMHEGWSGYISDILPINVAVAIKEPYCEAVSENTSGLRIDHPSDIVFLAAGDALYPEKWKTHISEDTSESPAEVMRVHGNEAFKKKSYRSAINFYTEGLTYEPLPALASSLLLNRAQANLQLGLFEAAASDAEEVLKLPDFASNEKALYRGSKAYYELRRFPDASTLLESLQKIHAENREASSLATKARIRLLEQNEGKYDWVSILSDAKRPTPLLEVADFLGPVKINDGLLTATDDIKSGDLMMCIKATSVLYPVTEAEDVGKTLVYDATRSMIGHAEGWKLTQKLAMKIHSNPGSAPGILELAQGLKVYGDSPVDGIASTVDGKPMLDIHVIDAIRESYATPFLAIHPTLPLGIVPAEGLGLWPLGTRVHLKHSCLPNASRAFFGDILVLRACRNIRRGETITLAHVEPFLPLEERRAELSRTPGATCTCEFCAIEEREGPAARQRRFDLVQRVKELSARAPSNTLRTDAGKDRGTGPDDAVVKEVVNEVTEVCQNLDATFSHPARVQPRFPMLEPLAYLFACYLYLGANYTEDAIRTNARLLMALGFSFDYIAPTGPVGKDDSGDVVVLEHGFYHPLVMSTLLQQSSVCWQLGKKRSASSWKRIAENATQIIAGHRRLFDEAYSTVYESLNWRL